MVWLLQHVAIYVRIVRGTAEQSQSLDGEPVQAEGAKVYAEWKQKVENGIEWGGSERKRSP